MGRLSFKKYSAPKLDRSPVVAEVEGDAADIRAEGALECLDFCGNIGWAGRHFSGSCEPHGLNLLLCSGCGGLAQYAVVFMVGTLENTEKCGSLATEDFS